MIHPVYLLPCVYKAQVSYIRTQSCSFLDPNSSHTHPSTHTHTRNTNLLARTPQLIKQRSHLSRPRTSQRMSERNSTSVRINLEEQQSLTLP